MANRAYNSITITDFFQMKKNQLDNQSLVPTKPNQNIDWDLSQFPKNRGMFFVKNAKFNCEDGEVVQKQNTVMKNCTESTVRESSVITKTVVRKKTIILNGEVVEQEEEEESHELEPSCTEFKTKSQSIFADQNILRGKFHS